VLGLAFAVALGMILLGDKLAVNSSSPRPTQALDRVGTRADALIADLHCPCPACGHSLLRGCRPKTPAAMLKGATHFR